MTTIAAQNNAGILQPATPIPSSAVEVAATSASYVVVADDDLYSGTPPSTPLQWVTNIFSGNYTPPASAASAGYQGLRTFTDSLNFKIARTHDYNGGSNSWRARWSKIEPAAPVNSVHTYDWALLDQFVAQHLAAGREVMHTLFGTPTWASARPAEVGSYGASNLGISAEPADLTNWDAYCTSVATRYKGRIKYYEIWNEPNLVGFYSGTQTILAQLVRRAAVAIKAVDPAALIVAPPVTTVKNGGSGLTYFTQMMAASDGAAGAMKDWVDIVAAHFYPDSYDTIATVADMVSNMRTAMASAGVSGKPLWNTEFTVLTPAFASLTVAQRRRAIQLMLLLACVNNAGGATANFWYAPDGATFAFDGFDIAAWNGFVDQLSKGVTVVNKLRDGRITAVIGGNRFMF